ncbi:MAG TPA: CGNR zinc finger domain-containing protein, partial [Steroidobacteraceae bacterium]
MQAVTHEFTPKDLVAGHPALDFANTVTARDTSPRDWLDGYARLLEWSVLAGVIDGATAARLASAATRATREATAALARARRVREALHDVCVALLHDERPDVRALRELEAAWKRASTRTGFFASDGQLLLRPEADSSGLDLPIDLVVFSAVQLLGEMNHERTRVCRGHDCGWLFIDTS